MCFDDNALGKKFPMLSLITKSSNVVNLLMYRFSFNVNTGKEGGGECGVLLGNRLSVDIIQSLEVLI